MSITLGHHNLTFLIWILNRFYIWDDDEKKLASGMTLRIKHWNMICHVCLSVPVCLEQTNSHQRGSSRRNHSPNGKVREPPNSSAGSSWCELLAPLLWPRLEAAQRRNLTESHALWLIWELCDTNEQQWSLGKWRASFLSCRKSRAIATHCKFGQVLQRIASWHTWKQLGL